MGRATKAGTYADTLEYSPTGRLTGLSDANGIDYVASPNTRGLLASESYGPAATPMTARSYAWDQNGNLDSITDAVAGGCARTDTVYCDGFDGGALYAGTDSRTYQYDTLDRLTKLTSSRYGIDQYRYDPLGNVRTRSGLVATTWHYDAATNRVSDENGSLVYSHDPRGNVTAIGTFTLTWNRANELIGDDFGATYTYDAYGWRVKMTTPASHPERAHSRYYLYDHAHRLIERRDNGVVTDYVTLGTRPIARIQNGQVAYVHTDYQNTPLFETNSSGAITRAPDYLAYGQPVENTGGLTDSPGYTGAMPDQATGLLYLGARYLHGTRFLSTDPAPLDPTNPMGLNRYAYGNANPARFVDPDGRQAQENCDEACQIRQQYERDFGRRSKLAHGAKSVADGASTTGDVIEIAYETAVLPSVKLGMLGRVGKWFSRLIKPAEREAAAFPKNASQIGHIFRDAPGHLPDTAASRKLLSDVASNPSNKVGVDRFGNTWSASTRADGTQVWVSTRDGVIQNGGLNKVPKTEFPTIIEP